MSTRSVIGILRKNSKGEAEVKSISCHFDGYPDGVGLELCTHYTDIEKIRALINLGDISALAPEVNPDPKTPHTFDNPQKGVVIAYVRDRGEDLPMPEWLSFAEFKRRYKDDVFMEYQYLYDTENEHWIYTTSDWNAFYKITPSEEKEVATP